MLDAIDAPSRNMAFALGTRRRFADKAYLIRESEETNGIFVILSGTVESLYESESNRSLILATWEAGDFIGGPYVVGNHVHAWSARALGAVEALHLQQDDLKQLIAASSSFALHLIECLGYKGERYSKLAQVLATHKAGERLALLLLELCRPHAGTGEAARKVDLIKQDRLANMIGATRQSVSLALLKLEESGAISIGHDSFFIHDTDTLRRHAGLDPLADRRPDPAHAAT